MSTIISVLLGALIVFPFLVTFFLVIFRKRGKAPAKVIGFAADVTTPFLFISVYIIARTIFGAGIGFTIATISIVITITFAVIERIKVKDFQIMRLLRKIWRLFFLILAVAYLIMLVVGVVLKVIEYV